MTTKEKYTVIKPRRKRKSKTPTIRFHLTEMSNFPGVIVEFQSVKMLEAPKEDGYNCEVNYNIIKVPKGKFQNMEDAVKEQFDNTIREVLIDLLKDAVKEAPEIQTLDKQ
jgi:hypothetical protein